MLVSKIKALIMFIGLMTIRQALLASGLRLSTAENKSSRYSKDASCISSFSDEHPLQSWEKVWLGIPSFNSRTCPKS
jgi:hypothetical protein